MRALIVVAVSVAVASCVSAGTKVTEQQVKGFQKGVTTETEVIAKLGQPTSTTVTSDGLRIDVYAFSSGRPDAVDFVPVVGLLAGGAHGTSTAVAFTFNPAGVLVNYSATTSNVNVHTGIAN